MYFLLVIVKLFRQSTEKGEGTKPTHVSEPLHRHHPVTSVIADRSDEERTDFHLRPFERVVRTPPRLQLDPGLSVLRLAALHTHVHT